MKDITYKNYSPEEDKVYENAIARIREGMRTGLTFGEACSMIEVKDKELLRFIVDDALKIMIAEMHYGQGLTLRQIAKALNVSYKRVVYANMEMLEDVGKSAAEVYKESNFDKIQGNA